MGQRYKIFNASFKGTALQDFALFFLKGQYLKIFVKVVF